MIVCDTGFAMKGLWICGCGAVSRNTPELVVALVKCSRMRCKWRLKVSFDVAQYRR